MPSPCESARAARRALTIASLALLAGCAAQTLPPKAAKAPASSADAEASARGLVRSATPPGVDIARARAKNAKNKDQAPGFSWEPWSEATFERARRERRFILLDGAAAWCHWCHVMEETTYRDPEIGRILKERFVAIRVDIDERPDIAERYGEWGWPATILFSPDAEELGKYRGYIPPDELKAILLELDAAAKIASTSANGGAAPAPIEALPWIAALGAAKLDDFYDPDQGSWGARQKAPLGENVQFELRRAAHGDAEAKARALFTLDKQRALIDPVWGGVYQYSAATDWASPHYEKLMPYQASNLEAYARAYTMTRDARFLADARRIQSYMTTFLSNPEGAFLVSQDADVGAHDEGAFFVDGDVYYRKDDQGRRKLGLPRVDAHVYPHENGLAIAAFAALYEATRDPEVIARARRAADLILRTLVDEGGSVRRGEAKLRYLADAASFGLSLCRLAEASGAPDYRDAAVKIGAAMERNFGDGPNTALFAQTEDPRAAGVFSRRERPFVPNILAARFLAALTRTTGDARYRDRGRRILAGVFTPSELAVRGRLLGGMLLALDEVGVFPWDQAKSP